MAASREKKHIRIDVLTRWLPPKAVNVTEAAVSLFTALICLIAAYYCLQFVRLEFEGGYPSFARVPAWIVEAVIPFGFAIIGARYLAETVHNLRRLTGSTS